MEQTLYQTYQLCLNPLALFYVGAHISIVIFFLRVKCLFKVLIFGSVKPLATLSSNSSEEGGGGGLSRKQMFTVDIFQDCCLQERFRSRHLRLLRRIVRPRENAANCIMRPDKQKLSNLSPRQMS